MNENKDFGLDSIKPLEPVSPIPEVEPTQNVYETTSFYTEPQVEQPSTQYAFTTEAPVIDPVVPVTPEPVVSDMEEIPVTDNGYTTSYTEMTTTEQPTVDAINEHPDAKISLHKESETETPVVSNLPEEKMDKGTMWMLIWIFVGMLAVIIALPYLFELF